MKLEKHQFNWKETSLFLIIMLITSLIPNLLGNCADCGISFGFPLPFYEYGGGLMAVGQQPKSWFFLPSLVLNMMIWFVVSYFLIRLYNKVKKK